jgi:hypothetical protein
MVSRGGNDDARSVATWQHNLDLSGSQTCIVTGPGLEPAVGLIDRMKGLFTNYSEIRFDSKETVIDLKGVHIETYPSHYLGFHSSQVQQTHNVAEDCCGERG